MSQLNPYSFFQTPAQLPGTAQRPAGYTMAGTDPADQALVNQMRKQRGQLTFGQLDQRTMEGNPMSFFGVQGQGQPVSSSGGVINPTAMGQPQRQSGVTGVFNPQRRY